MTGRLPGSWEIKPGQNQPPRKYQRESRKEPPKLTGFCVLYAGRNLTCLRSNFSRLAFGLE